MSQQTNELRERLLASLPQPENLNAYREETAALLAKHERAVRTDALSKNVLATCTVGVLLLSWLVLGRGGNADAGAVRMFNTLAGLMFLGTIIYDIRYRIYNSQVATLKEIKQIQLQILELQASPRKDE